LREAARTPSLVLHHVISCSAADSLFRLLATNTHALAWRSHQFRGFVPRRDSSGWVVVVVVARRLVCEDDPLRRTCKTKRGRETLSRRKYAAPLYLGEAGANRRPGQAQPCPPRQLQRRPALPLPNPGQRAHQGSLRNQPPMKASHRPTHPAALAAQGGRLE
jgi:hypothetical protein